MKIRRICRVEGCEKKRKSMGGERGYSTLCNSHYRKKKKQIKAIRVPDLLETKPDKKLCMTHYIALREGICSLCKVSGKSQKLLGAKSHIKKHIAREVKSNRFLYE